MDTIISKGSINRLGDTIRSEDQISETSLIELQSYRSSHEESLSRIFKILCRITKNHNNNNIVTYRIKRIESIIGKLSRYPKMKFSRMWDIGGCRCIFNTNKELNNVKKAITKQFTVKKIYNYVSEPQKEGYKAIHLFVSLPNDEKIIEIQLRNKVDHNWATLVEITDLLFDSKLKEYGENKELLRFHYLLSKSKELILNEKMEIVSILKKYKYFEKLSTIFSRNYLKVRIQWFEIENKIDQHFFLITAKKDKFPKISSFEFFDEAEEKYFELYKSSENTNIVLTHLPNPSFKQISIAYSNYILAFHSFFDECYEILESLIYDSLKTKNYIIFGKIFNMYYFLIFIHIKNLKKELDAINEYINNYPKQVNRKKKSEWVKDIKRSVSKGEKRIDKFQKKVYKGITISKFGRFIINLIITIIIKKYYWKFKRLK